MVGIAGAKPAPPGQVVKLLDAGTGAKHRLRLKPAVGWGQTVVMKVNMTMAMDAGPALHVPRTVLPTMVMTMQVSVSEVDKAGNAHYDLVLGDLAVEPGNAKPEVVKSLRRSLAKMKGFKGHATVDPRNFTLEGAFEIPPDVDASIKQMLDGMSQSITQLSSPLPEEPVGIGARWKAASTLSANGISVLQTAVYTLTKIDGDHIAFSVDIAQTADHQEVRAPGMPPGSKLSITTWKGTGTGDVELELDKLLLPVHATVSLGEHAKMLIEAGSDKQDMTMDIELGVGL
jgi:hypothetical protein